MCAWNNYVQLAIRPIKNNDLPDLFIKFHGILQICFSHIIKIIMHKVHMYHILVLICYILYNMYASTLTSKTNSLVCGLGDAFIAASIEFRGGYWLTAWRVFNIRYLSVDFSYHNQVPHTNSQCFGRRWTKLKSNKMKAQNRMFFFCVTFNGIVLTLATEMYVCIHTSPCQQIKLCMLVVIGHFKLFYYCIVCVLACNFWRLKRPSTAIFLNSEAYINVFF